MNTESVYFAKIVRGHIHQGQLFLQCPGIQCTRICLEAILFHIQKPCEQWLPVDIDNIIHSGDIAFKNEFKGKTPRMLAVLELPSKILFGGVLYKFCCLEDSVRLGSVMTTAETSSLPFGSKLDCAISDSFEVSPMLFLVYRQTTIVLIKHKNNYYIFDSHSRGELGYYCISNGKAVLLEFRRQQDLYLHLIQLFVSSNVGSHELFELTPVTITRAGLENRESNHSARNDSILLSDMSSTTVFTDELSDNLYQYIVVLAHSQINSLQKKSTSELNATLQNNRQQIYCDCLKKLPKLFELNSYTFSLSIVDDNVFEVVLKDTNIDECINQIRCALDNYVEQGSNFITSFLIINSRLGTVILEGKRYFSVLIVDGNCQVSEFCDMLSAFISIVKHFYSSSKSVRVAIVPINIKQMTVIRARMKSKLSTGKSKVKKNVRHSDKYRARKLDKKEKQRLRRHLNKISADTSDTSDYIVPDKKTKLLEEETTSLPETLRTKAKQQVSDIKGPKLKRKTVKYILEKKRWLYKNSIFFRTRAREYENKQYSISRKVSARKLSRAKDYYRYCSSVNKKTRERAIARFKNKLGVRIKNNQQKRQRYSDKKVFAKKLHRQETRMKTNDDKEQILINRSKRVRSHKKRINVPNNNACNNQIKLTRSGKFSKHTVKTDMEYVIDNFLKNVKVFPNVICACCFRLRFRKQTVIFRPELHCDSSLVEECVSTKYLHKCTNICRIKCEQEGNTRRDLYLCHTCQRYLKKSLMPPQCHKNGLELDTIPEELNLLSTLERHLISQRIMFMKVCCLPTGKQNSISGPVICVPSEINYSTNVLPRPLHDKSLILVKLKRKLEYQTSYCEQIVDLTKIYSCLRLLKTTNNLYKQVTIDAIQINQVGQDDEDDRYEVTTDEYSLSDDSSACHSDSTEEYEITEAGMIESKVNTRQRKVKGKYNKTDTSVVQDTCMQPIDLSTEALKDHDNTIFNIAPAEQNTPVSIFEDKTAEPLAFPVQFPYGNGHFNQQRAIKLTRSKYFNSRLLHADNRFASDPQYIFYAQYATELAFVTSSISIKLRESQNQTRKGEVVTAGMLTNLSSIKSFLQGDNGFRFLQTIRGTPQYWKRTMNDLLSMMRQLGMPTWFLTLSAAELSRWPEVVEAILKQQDNPKSFYELGFEDRAKAIRSNPVTAAIMFDHRVKEFFQHFLLSPANPLGEVRDFFFRVEFQQRGAPHIHCLLWIKDAPQLDCSNDQVVVEFIDQYITCEVPENEKIRDTVLSVQSHSKSHTKSCRKSRKECRFGFPKPPAIETFICRPTSESVEKQEILRIRQKLTKLKNAMNNRDNIANFLDFSGFSSFDEYKTAQRIIAEKTTVILKRKTCEIWINQYNKDVIAAWNANMDLQFVTNPSQLICYVVSYMCKHESELSEVMQLAKGNINPSSSNKDQMKQISQIYFKNREMSVQEAVYRVCSLKLKDSSRDVVYIPVDKDSTRISYPLAKLKSIAKVDADDKDIWMPNIVDKYINRPANDEFDDMCLAKFASSFRFVAASTKNALALQNNCGHIKRRQTKSEAVIRYVKPRLADSERYYYVMLKLYLPFRSEMHLKPVKYDTYEEFFSSASVKLKCQNAIKSVAGIVQDNKVSFEKCGEEFSDALLQFETNSNKEDAWALISDRPNDQSDIANIVSDDDVPELKTSISSNYAHIEVPVVKYDKSTMYSLMKSLNKKQKNLFYKIRKWCVDKRSGKDPKPFYTFVHGGAGVGKSHLIKCINYEAQKILRDHECPDKVTVVLSAFTGTAAYNIGGATLHSLLKLPIPIKQTYIPLTDDKLTSLRSAFSSVEILIIDEISMVSDSHLSYIHERLQQIKYKHTTSTIFGDISVIIVGDLFQLKPTTGSLLFLKSNAISNHLTSRFTLTELDEVMRQKDDRRFAELLNSIRTLPPKQQLNHAHISMLRTRQNIPIPKETLHVFALNKHVDIHNSRLLHDVSEALGEEVMCSTATDITMRSTGNSQPLQKPVKSAQGDLLEKLELCKCARVTLLRNLNVNQGLVNGAFGTVKNIVKKRDGSAFEYVVVKFDNITEVIKIHPYEENLRQKSHITRRQIPLKLAWASTIHKIQGATVNSIAVSLENIQSPGQAYVALSRATHLNGLYILGNNLHNIYCNSEIESVLRDIPHEIIPQRHNNQDLRCLNLFFMNIEGLVRHLGDFLPLIESKEIDCIFFNETWLRSDIQDNILAIDGYKMLRVDRKSENSNPYGGLAVYCKTDFRTTTIDVSNFGLEVQAVSFMYNNSEHLFVVMYRSPQSNKIHFCKQLRILLDFLISYSSNIIVLGDFNENLLDGTSHPISNIFESLCFVQQVKSGTTLHGTLIDHVYTRLSSRESVETEVIQTYFSYHEIIKVVVMPEH